MVVAGSMTEDYAPVGGSSAVDGTTSMQHCRSVESLGEWRSCEQVDNGTPSTSPPYWDSDDEDDSGPKPCDLYGKFTWKIEKFSQLNKKELRSNAFEVGGYKWYILIYPQGCDACNHLSLFLCVANHDKLLPGWSHFALFTIAVVNKDPKKNKYNDTLHRFWKKEHDWGWKKFMELNKVVDGFVDGDILTIKAQVQVIREKAHRPFRCLGIQYRRELIRVYLSAVEQTCARFVEEKKKQLQTLVDDKAQWSSFHSFWLGIDPNTRRLMSRDKTDVILKIVVKHFFIEKEVASTLIMDSLYTGLRVLESQNKLKKLRANLLEKEELPAPFIFIENNMFVLADDVFLLLERAALESAHLPLPSKEEKGLPSRTKDVCSGDEFNRDSILRDERRLTELGRRTLETFVFAHIFSSRIEIAYKEAVALKRQEELIREEEETEQAENDKREKRAKKKQARQRRNNRKGKDRGKGEKSVGTRKEKHALQDSLSDDRILEDFSEHGLRVNEKSDLRREDVSDVSDPGDDGAEALQPDAEDRDTNPLSWDTNTSETHHASEACRSDISNCHVEKKSSSFVDDSSSTCSTDSIPSVVVNGPYKVYSSSNNKNTRNSSNRGKKQQNKDMRHNSTSNADRLLYVSGSCSASGPEPEGNLHSFMDQTQSLEPIKKEGVDMVPGTKVIVKDQVDEEIPSNSKPTTTESVSSSANLNRKPSPVKQSTERHTTATTKIGWVPTPEVTSNTPIQSEKSVRLLVKSPQNLSISKSEDLKHTSQVMTSTTHQASSMSRPSSAPVIPVPKPTVPLVSTSQTMPLLSHTLSSTSRLDAEPSSSAQTSEPSFSAQTSEPQSYRNVIMGIRTATGASTSGFTPRFSSSSSTQSTAFSQTSSSLSSSSSHPSQGADRKDRSSVNHGIIRQDFLHNPHQRTDQVHSDVNNNMRISNESVISLRQSQGVMPDEFPHLDIINDLLDEDHRMVGRATFDGYHHHDDFHSMNQQYAFQGDLVTTGVDYLNASCQFDLPDYYYDELSQMVYDSFVPFHGISDMQPLPLDFSVYGNGTDALLQNQWPIDGADLSVLNFGNALDANGYPYQLPEYSACGFGGYNMMHQPANGR